MQPAATPKDTLTKAMPFLIALAGFGYAAAGYLLLISPALAKILPGSPLDLSTERAAVATLDEYGKHLAASLDGYSKLNPDNKTKVAGMVTADPSIHDLFVQVDGIAAKHGLVLVSIDASIDEKAVTQAGRKTIRASANLAGGGYPELKAFLAELEAATRISDVQSVVFSSGSANYNIVFRSYFVSQK